MLKDAQPFAAAHGVHAAHSSVWGIVFSSVHCLVLHTPVAPLGFRRVKQIRPLGILNQQSFGVSVRNSEHAAIL